jgi:FMN reductase
MTTERPLSLIVVTAGASESSSTQRLADRAAEATRMAAKDQGLSVDTVQIDVRRLAGEVTTALTSNFRGEALTEAMSMLDSADGLIVGTPVYNAGPSGLFTSFFQAIDDDLLIAKPVLLTATAASSRHALVIDNQIRPIFAYLRALTTPTSLFAAAEDWNDRDFGTRIDRAATELALLMASGFSQQVRETSWSSYRHGFGTAASGVELDFDSDMMRLAAGGSITPVDEGEPPAG